MIGIAYQQNIGLHTFEENEEQRYIKFVRLESSAPFLSQLLALRVNAVHGPVWIATDI